MSKFHHQSPFHAVSHKGQHPSGKESPGLSCLSLVWSNSLIYQGMENQNIFPQSWSSYPIHPWKIDGQGSHIPHLQLPKWPWMWQSRDLSILHIDGDTCNSEWISCKFIRELFCITIFLAYFSFSCKGCKSFDTRIPWMVKTASSITVLFWWWTFIKHSGLPVFFLMMNFSL